jgi:hypothetical protein
MYGVMWSSCKWEEICATKYCYLNYCYTFKAKHSYVFLQSYSFYKTTLFSVHPYI